MDDTNTLVIGIGNEFRSDDAAGLIAARKIKQQEHEGLDVEQSAGDGAGLMDMWAGRQNVILIDAVLSGAAPGTVHRLELSSRLLPAEFFKFSTHLFSIPQAIYLSASLGTLPDRLLILGIEGKSFEAGESISCEAETAINNIVTMVQKEIKTFQRNPREKLING